jgi:hypothetical protein
MVIPRAELLAAQGDLTVSSFGSGSYHMNDDLEYVHEKYAISWTRCINGRLEVYNFNNASI